MKILILDDDAQIAKSLKRVFFGLTDEVYIVTNARDASCAMASNIYDIFISDWNLEDGENASGPIDYARVLDVPVFIHTSDTQAAFDHGCVWVFKKNEDLGKMLTMVETLRRQIEQ